MGLIFKLSLRNLLRQKKRNTMLGLGIAFGMMILVIATAFSHGVVEVLIKDLAANAFGHLVIESKPGNSRYSVIRDKKRIESIVKATIKAEDLDDLDENLGTFVRAIGNGETDNVQIVGVQLQDQERRRAFFNDFFTLIKGNFDDYFSEQIEYPIIISQQKAKSLNVRLHDVIRVRVPMITGQVQAAKLTVIAIANSNNSFMDIALFMEGDRVKKMLGYKPWEAGALQISLNDPRKTATIYADLLHRKLKPNLISIMGKLQGESCRLLAFKNNETVQKNLQKIIRIIQGDLKSSMGKKGVLVSKALARKLQVKPGDELTYQYETKYRGEYTEKFKVTAIYESNTKLGNSVMLVNEERIHDTYDRYLPAQSDLNFLTPDHSLTSMLATEWKLLERSADSDALQKKNKQERRIKTDQTKLDVITMYEGASDVLQLEGVMNLITMDAVLVLFFIILIGVINTLRMTIKERTPEIGTLRAIGMQKVDVRSMFMMETMQLTAIACLFGIVLGMVVIFILGSIRLDINNGLSIILKNRHLYFKINPLLVLANFIFIMVISALTAYFPSRRAAKLHVVEALCHSR